MSAKYTLAFKNHLPPGQLLLTDDSEISLLLSAFAIELQRIEDRAQVLLSEANIGVDVPRETLDDWEVALGLPDDCVVLLDDISRSNAIISRLRGYGDPHLAYLENLVEPFVYNFTIQTYESAKAGFAVAGGDLFGEEYDHVVDIFGPADPDLSTFMCFLNHGKQGHILLRHKYDIYERTKPGPIYSLCFNPREGWIAGGDGVWYLSKSKIVWSTFTGIGIGQTHAIALGLTTKELFVGAADNGKLPYYLENQTPGTLDHFVASGFVGSLYGICWSDTLACFIAVGETGEIQQSSSDALTWTHRAAGSSYTGDFLCACANSTAVYIAGEGGEIQKSTNGSTWTRVRTGSGVIRAIAASATKIVAGTSTGALLVSADAGATWVSDTTHTDQGWRDIKYDPSTAIFLAVGDNKTVFVSEDNLATYKEVETTATVGQHVLACAFGEKRWMIAGAAFVEQTLGDQNG